jgi:hypothetical protein
VQITALLLGERNRRITGTQHFPGKGLAVEDVLRHARRGEDDVRLQQAESRVSGHAQNKTNRLSSQVSPGEHLKELGRLQSARDN